MREMRTGPFSPFSSTALVSITSASGRGRNVCTTRKSWTASRQRTTSPPALRSSLSTTRSSVCVPSSCVTLSPPKRFSSPPDSPKTE